MTRPVDTVRTARLVWLADEPIPLHLHPKSCMFHVVTWWQDEPTVDEVLGKRPECPCCNGDMPMNYLLNLEAPKLARLAKLWENERLVNAKSPD